MTNNVVAYIVGSVVRARGRGWVVVPAGELEAAMQRGKSLGLDTVVNELLAEGEPDQSG